MVCTTCPNSYVAAKKGHSECMYHCARLAGWHKDTAVGAIEGGHRHIYDTLCGGRHVGPQIIPEAAAAASRGWLDVVEAAIPCVMRAEKVNIAMLALSSGHTRIAELVFRALGDGVDNMRGMAYEKAVLSGKVDSCVWAEYFWVYTEEELRQERKVLIKRAIDSQSYDMLQYIVDRFGLPTDPNIILRYVVANTEDYYMFKYLWDKVGDKSLVEPCLKNCCIEKNRIEVLRCIHESVPTWPEAFLQIARTGRQSGTRRYLIRYAEEHGALEVNVSKKRALHEMMEIIDDLGMPEGQYIKVCRLMRDLHTDL